MPDGQLPTIRFDVASYNMFEGGGSASVAVVRSVTSGPASVYISDAEGSASASTDYAFAPHTIEFVDGLDTVVVSIPIGNDQVAEGSEPFFLTLSGPSAGYELGSIDETTVTIFDRNIAPVSTVPSAQSLMQNATVVFSSANGNAIRIADEDAGSSSLQVTLMATNGAMSLSGTTGLAFSFSDANGTGEGDGVDDATMHFRGSLSAINTALNGLSFTPSTDYTGSASVAILTNDLAIPETSGPMTDTDTVAITIHPGAIIGNGTVQLGVNPAGQLNVGGGTSSSGGTGTTIVGLRYLPTNSESMGEGTPAEGWGAADVLTQVAGYANQGGFAASVENITAVSFTSTATTATSVVAIGSTLSVTHEYMPSTVTTNLYEIKVTVENVSGAAVDLRYRRVFDWDIEPTAFSEFVTVDGGGATSLMYDSNNGFASANPLSGPSDIGFTGDFDTQGPADHGALFDFQFGMLPAGASRTFTLFYGAASSKPAALAALAAVGANTYSLGQPTNSEGEATDSPNTFIFGYANGAPEIRVPGTQRTIRSTPVVFSNAMGNAISIIAPNVGSSQVQVTLRGALGTLTLPQTTGLSFSFSDSNGTGTGDGTNDTELAFRGTIADINAALNGMTFTPSTTYPGVASVEIVVNDLGNTTSGEPQVTVSTVSITDPPVNSVPSIPQSTTVNTALVFSAANGNGISVADPDIGSAVIQVTLSGASGTLTLGGTTGLTFTTGTGAGDTSMTFFGNIAAINAALDGLVFSPTQDFQGSAWLTIQSNDLGSAGTGYSLTDQDTVSISVDQTLPIITWNNPANIFYGIALSEAQLNATADVAGTFSYSLPVGPVLGAGFYTLYVTFTPSDSIHYATVTKTTSLTVTPAVLTVTVDNLSMIYRDDVPPLSFTYIGLVNSDPFAAFSGELSTLATSFSGAGSYSIDQGTLSATGNYIIGSFNPGAITIAPRALWISGLSGSDKDYDGTTADLIAGTASLNGVIGTDDVQLQMGTASFANPNAGLKPVTFSGFQLIGTKAGNYELTQPAETWSTIRQVVATITVTGFTGTYDRQAHGVVSSSARGVEATPADLSGLLHVDSTTYTTVPGGQVFWSFDGNSNYLMASGYATVTINKATLTVVDITPQDKVYDGTTAATLDYSSAELLGVLGTDDITLATGAASVQFGDPNVGENKPLSVSALGPAGADAGNYELSQPTGLTAAITPFIPLAFNGAITTDQNTLGTGTLGGSDIDPSATLTYAIISPAAKELAVVTDPTTGAFSFDPQTAFKHLGAGQSENVAFDFNITDNYGATSLVKTETITVTGLNDAPVAQDVAVTTRNYGILTAAFDATDVDDGDTLSYSIVTGLPIEQGTVTSNNNGTFTFVPADAFKDPAFNRHASFTFTYQAFDSHGAPSAIRVVTISDLYQSPVIVIANALEAFPDVSGTWAVATFVDPNGVGAGTPYKAYIDWGDGQTSSGMVSSNPDGSFTVTGTNTYPWSGTFTVTIQVVDAHGDSGIAVSTATVEASPEVGVYADDFSTDENRSVSGQVALLTSSDSSATADDFTASIVWGDGQISSGVVVEDSSGDWRILADHTYGASGTYTFTVSVTGLGGQVVTASGTAAVDQEEFRVSVADVAVSVNEEFTGTLAAFSGDDRWIFASNYTVDINWGDGQNSSGVVTGSAEDFSIEGSHTYASVGSFALTVTVTDPFGQVVGGGATATVTEEETSGSEPPTSLNPSFAAVPMMAAANQPFSGLVATFVDPGNVVDDPTLYTAEIAWGDGETSSGSVLAFADGSFGIAGAHVFTSAGTYSVTASLTPDGTSTVVFTTEITVQPSAIVVATPDFSPTEDGEFSGLVTEFTQVDPNATDFYATVIWGDGASSDAEILGNDDSSFSVFGEHTYSESGDFTVTVTVTDDLGNSTSASGTITVSTAVPANPPSVTANYIKAAVGQSYTASFGSFIDPDDDTNPANFTAEIVLEGGQTQSATLVPDGAGGFDIEANVSFPDPGFITWTINVTKLSTGAVSSDSGTAFVSLAALTATPVTASLELVPGQSFSDEAAWFSNIFDDGSYGSGSYYATISWGDGQTSLDPVVSSRDGGYGLSGSHAYSTPGDYQIVASVYSSDGFSASASFTATVSVPLIVVDQGDVSATQNHAIAATLAYFIGPSLNPNDYVASIEWGDGDVTLGTVAANDLGGFEVQGEHVFTSSGVFSATVIVTSQSGKRASDVFTVNVAAAPLIAEASPLWAAVGGSFTQIVSWFAAANAAAVAEDFSAEINWGDGETSAGTIVANPNEGFDVQGTHLYACSGSFTVTTTIADSANNNVTVSDTATVDSPGIVARSNNFNGQFDFADEVVTTFASTNPSATSDDFTATIDWGDGDVTSGLVVANDDRTFAVLGTHSYAYTGSYLLSVSIAGPLGESASTVGSVGTDSNSLYARGALLTVEQGTSFTRIIATVLNPGVTIPSTQIDWGDGSPPESGTIVVNPDGTISVAGTHTYSVIDTYDVAVTLTDGPRIGTALATLDVVAVYCSATPQSVSANKDVTFSGDLVVFTSSLSANVEDLTAEINWGDSSPSSMGNIVAGDDGQFHVLAAHTYSASGSYSAQVTISGPQESTSTVSLNVTVADVALNTHTVESGALTLTVTDRVADQNEKISGILATLQHSQVGTGIDDLTAVILWGDGNVSNGQLVANALGFEVLAEHAYAESGHYGFIVSVADEQDNFASVGGVIYVERNTLSAIANTVTAVEGQAFSGTLAIVTDPAITQTSELSAQIVWGDGQISSSSISSNGDGSYSVNGSHTFANRGTYSPVVQLSDSVGQSATAIATVKVASAISATMLPFAVAQGQTPPITLAKFVDETGDTDPSHFVASIDWRDGTTSSGTIESNPEGSFKVTASHPYATPGEFVVAVTVRNQNSGYENNGTAQGQAHALGTTATWTGNQSNLWSDAGNWDLGNGLPAAQAPGPLANVIINTEGANIVLDAPGQTITVNSLTLLAGKLTVANGTTLSVTTANAADSAGQLRIRAGTTLNVAGTILAQRLDWTGGTLEGSGATQVSGTMDITGPVTHKSGLLELKDQGVGVWHGGTITSHAGSVFLNNGQLTVKGAGSWDTASQPGFVTATLRNNGAFIHDAAGVTTLRIGTIEVNGPAVNPAYVGLVQVKQGTLRFGDGDNLVSLASANGYLKVDAGATLEFKAGMFYLDPKSRVAGDGIVSFSGGIFESDGAYDVGTTNISAGLVRFGISPDPGPNLVDNIATVSTINGSFTGGMLSGWQTFNISGKFTWTAGEVRNISQNQNLVFVPMANQNTMVIQAGAELTVLGTNPIPPANITPTDRFLRNHGIIRWVSVGMDDFSGLRQIDNYGLFRYQPNGPKVDAVLRAGFNNYGTGTLDIQRGRLQIGPGPFGPNLGAVVPATGAFIVANNATLALGHSFGNPYHLGKNATLQALRATIVFYGDAIIDCAYNVAHTIIESGAAEFNTNANTGTAILSGGLLSGSGSFTYVTSFVWTGGGMAGTGKTIVANGQQLQIVATQPLSLSLDRVFENNGEVIWTGAGGWMTSTPNGAGTLDNWGTVTKTGDSIATIDAGFDNYGILDIQQGTLQLGGGGSIGFASTVNVAVAASLEFYSGDFQVDLALDVPGSVNITGATVTFSDAVTIYQGSLTEGTMTGNVVVTVVGEFYWTGGALQGITVVVAGPDEGFAGGMLLIDNDGDGETSPSMRLAAVLDNYGTVRTIGDSVIGRPTDDNTSVFNNRGDLIVEGDSMTIGVTFNNTDTVTIESGDLTLSGGGQSNIGRFNLSQFASLTFRADYTLNATSSVAMAPSASNGTVFFSGGIITVQCALLLPSIVIEAGQAVLNANFVLEHLILRASGTLTGPSTVTVNKTLDWGGGTMTGGGATVVSRSASMFIHDDRDRSADPLPRASYRTITNHGRAYWHDDVIVSFQGSVIFNNEGVFSAIESDTLENSGVNRFNNRGTFIQDSGNTIINVPFFNLGLGIVRVDSGNLTLRTGSSRGQWSIKDDASLTFAGRTSNGTPEIYYLYQPSLFIDSDANNQSPSRNLGVVVVDAQGAAGLRIQSLIRIPRIDLDNGTISGPGNLVITNRMIWSNGTMNNARDGGNTTYQIGSVTIASNAALFILGNVTDKTPITTADPISVLNRPLNLLGKVGWVGNPGDVKVTLFGVNKSFLNNQAMTNAALTDIPAPSAWSRLRGGYGRMDGDDIQGSAAEVALAIRNHLMDATNHPNIPLSAGWWGPAARNITRPQLPAFFGQLPAVVRASLEAALRGAQAANQPFGASLANIVSTNGSPQALTAFMEGRDPAASARGQFARANALDWAKMAGGFVVGATIGQTIEGIQTLGTLIQGLWNDPIALIEGVWNGAVDAVKQFIIDMRDLEFANLARTVFPDLAKVCDLYQVERVISYDGGFYLGKGLASAVSQVAVTFLTAGSGTAVSTAANAATTAVRYTLNTLRGTVRAIANGTRQAVRTGVQVLYNAPRATATFIRVTGRVTVNVATFLTSPQRIRRAGERFVELLRERGQAIRDRFMAPHRSVQQTGSPSRISLPLVGCFVAGTPLLTPEGEKPIELFREGDEILSRSDRCPEGPVEIKIVEKTIVHQSAIMSLRIAGQEIRTTGEHPFYVRGRGWTAAKEIVVGDELLSDDNRWLVIEALGHSSEVVPVFNLTVSDHHTYFVGSRAWGFAVWAHNDCELERAKVLVQKMKDAGVQGAQDLLDILNSNVQYKSGYVFQARRAYSYFRRGTLQAIEASVSTHFSGPGRPPRVDLRLRGGRRVECKSWRDFDRTWPGHDERYRLHRLDDLREQIRTYLRTRDSRLHIEFEEVIPQRVRELLLQMRRDEFPGRLTWRTIRRS